MISPFSFLILLIWFFSLCFLISLANGLSILFIFSKNQLLALLFFAMVSFVSFAFISALIFKISFLLPTLGFFLSSFSSCFRCSVQFSHSVVSNSLRPHELQHARPPCPSPTPRVHSDSHPSSQWCHPAISSSVVPFSSCLQSLLASESFPMSQLFTWGVQSTRVSALASFLPKKSQGWSPSEWTD